MKLDHLGFEPKRFTLILFITAVVLVIISLTLKLVQLNFDPPHMRALIALFYVDLEHNIPTWFSSILLLTAALCLGSIAFVVKQTQTDKRTFRYWCLLALLFIGLSIDEVSQIHEYPIEPLRNALNAGGLLYYTWVLPGILFVLAVPIYFWPLLKSLPREVRNGMILAGAIFVGGAIGVEMLSGLAADHSASAANEDTSLYVITVSVEEFMEMTGVIFFIFVLLNHLKSLTNGIEIDLVPASSSLQRNQLPQH